MIIGINGNEANIEHRVGVGQYAFELLSHLKTPAKVYLSSAPRPDMPRHFDYQVFGPKKLWTLLALQKRLLGEKLDVFFTPTHYAPLYLPCPSVISIMDMSFERFPGYFKKKDLYQLKYWTKLSAKNAAHILTISEFSKSEIHKIYGIPLNKITVTPLGYDTKRFRPISTKTENYLLYLGTLQPRKNLVRLVEAFAALSDKSVKLMVVGMINEGRGGWLHEDIFTKVKGLGLDKRVVFTGYVPDDQVPQLMAKAKAYVLPSLYEGFGIPPIEAMATGVPVVVSRVASLPEVCGQAAIYIEDPYDISSIQRALQEALLQTPTQRAKRIELGLSWVKRYNWKDTAKKTLEVLYESAQR